MEKKQLVDLVGKAKAGDPAALDALLTEFYYPLHHYIRKMVDNEDDVLDITQATCLAIMEDLQALRASEAFVTWAYTIARNQTYRHMGKAAREVVPEPMEDDETILDKLPDAREDSLPEQVVEDKEFQQTLQDMIDSLPAEQRTAMLLYYYEGLTVRDIAQIQDVTEGTVKSRLNYGRKSVERQVNAYEKKNNIKLHSVSILPVLYFLFRLGEEEAKKTVPLVIPTAAAATGAAVGATAAGGGLMAKIVGVALTVALVGGTVAGVVALIKPEEDPEDSYTQDEDDGRCDNDPVPLETEPEETEPQETEPEETEPAIDWPEGTEGLEFWYREDFGGYFVTGYSGTERDLIIPATYEGEPVVGLTNEAFQGNQQITSIRIPPTVTSLGLWTFRRCENLTHVEVAGYIEYVLPDTFSSCSNLVSVEFLGGVGNIGEMAFAFCGRLESLDLSASRVENIGRQAFSSCWSLAELDLSGGVGVIEDVAFSGCEALTTLDLSAGVQVIGSASFQNCHKLETVILPETVESIAELAFEISPVQTVIYAGTCDQFRAICTENHFPEGTTVVCSDGEINY